MKQRGHVVDEAVCFILVRLCYNQLRDAWYPGGYPPKRSSTKVHETTSAHCGVRVMVFPGANAVHCNLLVILMPGVAITAAVRPILLRWCVPEGVVSLVVTCSCWVPAP